MALAKILSKAVFRGGVKITSSEPAPFWDTSLYTWNESQSFAIDGLEIEFSEPNYLSLVKEEADSSSTILIENVTSSQSLTFNA